MMKKLLLLGIIAILSSCQNSKIDYTYPEDPKNIRHQRSGKFFDDITLFGNKKSEEKKQKSTNKNQLWLASVEVISGLLPINTADESSGLITTEWYNTGSNQDKRIKINLLVKGSEPQEKNLILTIFNQSQDAKGNWIDDKNDDQNLTNKLIKDKIIQKAKSNS